MWTHSYSNYQQHCVPFCTSKNLRTSWDICGGRRLFQSATASLRVSQNKWLFNVHSRLPLRWNFNVLQFYTHHPFKSALRPSAEQSTAKKKLSERSRVALLYFTSYCRVVQRTWFIFQEWFNVAQFYKNLAFLYEYEIIIEFTPCPGRAFVEQQQRRIFTASAKWAWSAFVSLLYYESPDDCNTREKSNCCVLCFDLPTSNSHKLSILRWIFHSFVSETTRAHLKCFARTLA